MKSLGFIDKYLPIWIGLSMIIGVLLGVYVPSAKEAFESGKFADVSGPIAAGMIWMIYPVMCKIRYETVFEKGMGKHILISLVINWIIAPLFMVALGWATLPDLADYRSGLILVGTARCIAMVLIWNDLADGSIEYCAIIVAINSVLQILLYGPLSFVYVKYLGGGTMNILIWPVVRSVLVFLGIPLAAGFVTRAVGIKAFGDYRYKRFLNAIGPTSLLALLYVIIVMFASQGKQIVDNIGTVFRVVVPLVIYFGGMFSGVLLLCQILCIPYPIMVTQCFTAASNNFELAIAVASSVYGVDSKEAMTATIGPLVEVPVLVALVYVVRYINKYWYSGKIKSCVNEKCTLDQIVFACVRNAGRSQMASAFFNDIHGYKRFKAVSAGSNPAENIHDEIKPILTKLNIDIDELKPRKLTTDMVNESKVLVTMGCGESCPYNPNTRVIAWDIEDPCGQSDEKVLEIAMEIRDKCLELEQSLMYDMKC
jgi:arsenical-resistance protein